MNDAEKAQIEKIVRDEMLGVKESMREDLKQALKTFTAETSLLIIDNIASKNKEIMEEEIKPIKLNQENMQERITTLSYEAKFVKWAGYTFASIVAVIGWDKFTETVKSLFS